MTPKICHRKICMTNIILKLYVFISALTCLSAVRRPLHTTYITSNMKKDGICRPSSKRDVLSQTHLYQFVIFIKSTFFCCAPQTPNICRTCSASIHMLIFLSLFCIKSAVAGHKQLGTCDRGYKVKGK